MGSSEKVLAFGPFELFRDRKLLLAAGKRMRLSSRVLEILVALVERAGEIVSKNELLAYAWPGGCRVGGTDSRRRSRNRHPRHQP